MLGDLFQAGIGSIAQEDIAVSVLSTVMSHQRAARRFFIDAGGLALSKDRSTASLATDCGYGALLDVEGRRYGDLIVNDVAQEHGFVELEAGTAPPSIGTQLRVIPNHACMTAAMYEEYTVIDGSHVVARWPRINGW